MSDEKSEDQTDHPVDDRTDPGADEQADDDLLQELRELVARTDAVPRELLVAAKAAYVWHTIDAELAALVQDSVVDHGQMALVRGTTAPEIRTFEASGVTLEVETIGEGRELRLLGQVVPPGAGQVEVRQPGGVARTVEVDDLGRFEVGALRPGAVSLHCRAGGATVDTDWFLA